jgi:hypothetical protein
LGAFSPDTQHQGELPPVGAPSPAAGLSRGAGRRVAPLVARITLKAMPSPAQSRPLPPAQLPSRFTLSSRTDRHAIVVAEPFESWRKRSTRSRWFCERPEPLALLGILGLLRPIGGETVGSAAPYRPAVSVMVPPCPRQGRVLSRRENLNRPQYGEGRARPGFRQSMTSLAAYGRSPATVFRTVPFLRDRSAMDRALC